MMAYVNFSDRSGTAVMEPLFPPARIRSTEARTFTQREWVIVSLARTDSRGSIQPDTRMARIFRTIFGIKRENPLSDNRLEALRRMAVLSWHDGYNVAPSEILAFLEAGYSERQYELLAERIVAARADRRGKNR
ncbi:hypothetical protein SLG_34600 [Sphingobium sp. SYK-6]|nr:hypothetical protein SLG_34600 [Sphingobium sp. SYK-6]